MITSKALLPLLALLTALPVDARPLVPLDLAAMSRIGETAVSPDGRWLVWDQQETDDDLHSSRRDLWRLDLGRAGAVPEPIPSPRETNALAPSFAKDGTLYFLSDRENRQNAVYHLRMPGGIAERVTGPYDLSGFEVSPTNDAILVWADRPVGAHSLDYLPSGPSGPGSGLVFDHLFIRHWTKWADGLRSQLFIVPMRNGRAEGAGLGLAPELTGDTPSRPRGGREEVTWSVDGRSVFFATREAGRIEPLSENFNIFKGSTDGAKAASDLTPGNKAIDTDPAISPNGRWLAWVATSRPGYESDRHVVWLRELATGRTFPLTDRWDRSVDSLRWAIDSRSLLVTAADALDHPIFSVDVRSGSVLRLTGAGHASNALPVQDGAIIFEHDSLIEPPDLWMRGSDGRMTRLTAVNASRLAEVAWPTVTRFSYNGAGGDPVRGLALRPAGAVPGGKYPVAFLVHGGPQSTFADAWSYGWNMAAWTSHGYAVVSVDFHGSTGYGQAFTDSVNRDWGGKPLTDLKLGLSAAIARFDYLDGTKVCAAGGSYGGYMMNWIEGHWPSRFRCLVQHDGVFDERAMTYETDELAPDRWDFGNKPYYETPAEYERWNPAKDVASWATPQLVITGEKDFRSPYTQAIAAFTALQMRDVPSKLLVFPDEGHIVVKPPNSVQWYSEVFGWMDRWTKSERSQSVSGPH